MAAIPTNVRRDRLAGIALALMLAITMACTVWPSLIYVAGALTWLAAWAMWPRVSKQQRVQVSIVISVGVAGLVWGAHHATPIDWMKLLVQNQLIIAMLTAISLLRLLNTGIQPSARLATGRSAFIKSVLGLHLFGAVINISALVIMADRLARAKPLSQFEALSISRVFTMAVFYSPFIGGMALALTYTPGSSLAVIFVPGVLLAAIGLTVLLAMARVSDAEGVANFRGYPIQWQSLWLPAVLAGSVALAHQLAPQISVLLLIIILTPLIAVSALFVLRPVREASVETRTFLLERLPELSGEVFLFLAAGVLSTGLYTVFSSLSWLPFEVLNATSAAWILVSCTGLAFIGIHPIVVVSTVVPVLAPIAPAPNLLAFLCVCCWGIGCAVCPMSGTNVTLHARYGVNNWKIALANIPYASVLTGFAIALFFIFQNSLLNS